MAEIRKWFIPYSNGFPIGLLTCALALQPPNSTTKPMDPHPSCPARPGRRRRIFRWLAWIMGIVILIGLVLTNSPSYVDPLSGMKSAMGMLGRDLTYYASYNDG